MDQSPRKSDLMAFADGELDGDAKIKLLKQLAEQPDAARALIHQQQLRDAVKRSVNEATPPVPYELREQLNALAEKTDVADTAPIAKLGFVGRWMPAAVAAMLLIGAVVVLNVIIRLDQPGAPAAPSGSNFASTTIDTQLVSDGMLERFERRHVDCTTVPGTLMEADWPQNLKQLPQALSDYLGAQTSDVLDLSALGYRFAGAGPCHVPGNPSAHLIYHSIKEGRHESLSLWMRPDDGRYDIPENHVHMVTNRQAAHPVMLWRSDGVIYYLVGDSPLDTEKACDRLVAGCGR